MRSKSNMTQSSRAETTNPYLRANSLGNATIDTCDSVSPQGRRLAWQVAPNLIISFKYAWAGVRYAFITQRNFRVHTFIGIFAVSLGVCLKIAAVEMAVVALTCALVLVLELLNTALESVVDLTVGQSYHELARIAKDCAAGAVLISAIAALLVASFILLPPLFTFIISW